MLGDRGNRDKIGQQPNGLDRIIAAIPKAGHSTLEAGGPRKTPRRMEVREPVALMPARFLEPINNGAFPDCRSEIREYPEACVNEDCGLEVASSKLAAREASQSHES